MKKSIFLFFAAILCAMTAKAYDQAAVDLYFDNSTSKWANCYVSVGHTGWTAFYDMQRVSGTQYLWKLPANFNGGGKWGGASGWVVSVDKWDGYPKAENITVKYVWHGDQNVTKLQTTAWANTKIYKADGTESVSKDGTTKKVYKVTSYTKSNYTVTINTVEGGTLTVKDYDNQTVATGASKIHLTVLKFSATPASGYVFDGVQINNGSTTTTISAAKISSETYTLTSNVTITPVWKATTSTVTVTTSATNGTVTGAGVYEEGTSVTLTATADAGYQFKNWTVAGAEVSTANPYTFTVNADITVTANFEETPKATIYFVNNSGWSKIQAYAWEGTKGANPGWPGADITANKLTEKIGEYDVYSYTVEQGSYGKVIFNNGSTQTADYVWTDGNYYWYDSNIKKEDNFAGGTKAQAEEKFSVPVEYDYVYLINTNDWAKAHIYTWTPEVAGWPGAEMTKEAEKIAGKDVYSYKVVKGTTFGGLNFNCGSDECKTGDLTWQAGKYYAPSKDTWYADAAAAEAGLAAPVVNTYTVVGSSAPLFGTAWAPELTANDMALVEGTKYQLVKSDVNLAGGEIKYKVAVNHAWTESYPATDAVLNIAEAGRYTITFTFDSNTKEVGATAKLEEAAVVLPTVGVKGAWDGWAATTTLTGDNTSASATVNIATAGIYEFGLDVDGNFQASGATIDKANNSTVVTTNAGNMKLKANVLGDYTFTWTYETKTLVVTYPAGEEVDLNKYYVIGLSGNWDIVPANELVPVSVGSKEYSLVANMTAGTHEFKVSDATKDNTYGYAELTKKNYNELSEGEYSNIKLTLVADAEVTITFNGETKAITLTSTALTENTTALTYTVTVPAGTAKCYICGAWDWNTFMEMTPTANANEFTIDIVGATTAQEYKYTCGAGWEYAEVNADGSTRANRTYNANDVVEKWADVITYVLMGVNGDWDNGIALTQNPGNADEYVLESQVIIKATDAVKVVTLTNGTATAWCGNVDTWSNATYTGGGNDNIVLEDGIYTFYFKKTANNIYINQTGYARNVTNTYGTICLPYASASTTGATFFKVVGQETGKVYLESVTKLEAGVPYIFEKSASQIKVVYTGEKKTTAGSANGLVGTFADDTQVPNNAYILYGGKFCTNNDATKPNKINAYRAYLDLSAVTGGAPQQMPGRRYIGMSVQGENEATGVEDLFTTDAPVKVIENGQLIIIRDGVKYNVQGQKL